MQQIAPVIAKTVLFIALFFLFASLIDSSKFISLNVANHFAKWLHGNANQENYDDLWFFTDVILSLILSFVSCKLIFRLFKISIRKKQMRSFQRTDKGF